MKLRFPFKGIDKGRSLCEQPEFTTSYLNNVRPRDVLDNRMRGGQRPGLDKWGDGDQVGGAEQPVVAMCMVSSVA
jgi:hypothetical protein